jgi:acetyl-CoA C-acetyltransferase
MDGRAPLVAGVGMVEQRIDDDPASADEPLDLMLRAVHAAAADSGAPELLKRVQLVASPRGLWQYGDAGRWIAEQIGAPDATTVLALVGVLQQTLIGDACRRVADGQIDVALVVGGEARYRKLRGRILGVDVDEREPGGTPDVTLQPTADLVLRSEIDSGLGPMPVGYYAIIESALRATNGESLDAHRARLGALYHRFSEIAAANPHAWKREPVDAAFITEPSDRNPMLAFPYTKLHNSSWNVDQATALLICSEDAARAAGVDPERAVYARSSAESNHATTVSARPVPAASPGARLAGRAALDAAGTAVADLALVELYSCFPAAVQLHAREIGVSDAIDWTVTGGMPFAGGPFNSYVLQSTATMVERLRALDRGATGLVSSVSGLLTKQGIGVWSKGHGANPFTSTDVTADVAAVEPPKPVVDAIAGDATVVGCTVMHSGEGEPRGILLLEDDTGNRTMRATPDWQPLQTEEWVGRRI